MYHLWVGLLDGETRNISAITSKFTSPIQFAQKYFDRKPLYLPLDECNIDFLNQFAGAEIPGWRTNILVSKEEKFIPNQFGPQRMASEPVYWQSISIGRKKLY